MEETRAAISDPPQSSFVPGGPSVFRYSFCSLSLYSSMKKPNKGVFFFGGGGLLAKNESERTRELAFHLLFLVFNLHAGKQNKAEQKHHVQY